VGVACLGLVSDARELLVQPACDLFVVAFLGQDVGLRTASVQAAFEELADVFGMVREAEVATDDCRHPRGGSECIGPPVRGGPLPQQAMQFGRLYVGEARRGSGVGFGGQAVGAGARGLLPAVEGGASDAQDAGNGDGRFTLAHEFDGAAPAAFEFGRSSDWSAHT
jgi:hypothetical protein